MTGDPTPIFPRVDLDKLQGRINTIRRWGASSIIILTLDEAQAMVHELREHRNHAKGRRRRRTVS